MRHAHGRLLAIAQLLEPTEGDGGTQVRERVERALDELTRSLVTVPDWLQPRLTHLVTVLRRLGDGLYHCYDVPGLPRTNNDLEQFYRKIKASERRITGHRRSDSFVVRVGGFAVYALVASDVTEGELQRQLARVPACQWQGQRVILRANQERQVKMRRFHLHRAAYLADLEDRWTNLAQPP